MRFKALTAKSAKKDCGGSERDAIGSGPNLLVPEANPDGTCRFHKLPVRVDHFHATNGMGDIHGLDPSTAQANHLAEVSLSDEIYCGDPRTAFLPMIFHLYLRNAAFTAARMTAFRPGASPPPVQIPMQRTEDIGHATG